MICSWKVQSVFEAVNSKTSAKPKMAWFSYCYETCRVKKMGGGISEPDFASSKAENEFTRYNPLFLLHSTALQITALNCRHMIRDFSSKFHYQRGWFLALREVGLGSAVIVQVRLRAATIG